MKILNAMLFSLLAFPAAAHEITSPFYLPQMGGIQTETAANYTKNKLKETTTSRVYQHDLSEKITLGLGAGLAALIEGQMDWTKQKQYTTLSYPHTKTYGAGLKGQWELSDILTQLSVLYHQTTNVFFEPRRKIESHLYLGKQLKSMTPYLHLTGNFPLNARTELNNPIYRVETGTFQKINEKMTLDTALYLNYDKNIKGRSYGIRGELAYLICSWSSVGVKAEWQARGHAKNDADTYHQSVGINLRFSF